MLSLEKSTFLEEFSADFNDASYYLCGSDIRACMQ